MSNRVVYRLFWIPSALAIAGMSVAYGMQPESLPVPGPSKVYRARDHSFSLKHPGNWKASSRSSHGVQTEVEFKASNHEQMAVTVDLQGSLMADIMRSSDSQMSSLADMPGMPHLPAPKQKSPLERLHEMQGKQMEKDAEDYAGYEEGTTKPLQIAGRDALQTAFTFRQKGLFAPRRMTGRRVTLLSGDNRVSIVFFTSTENTKLTLPIYREMLDSLEFGQGGGQ